MADNTTLNSGSGGDTIASDDIGGIKYPRSKIVIGADGTNDGDVSSANPLPVTGTVTANLGTTDNTVLDAIAASLVSIDTHVPALGQALAAASVPIVLTAAQLTTLTPPAAITGFGTAANQTTIINSLSSIDGHVDGVEGALTSIDAKMTACNTGAVVIASSALPTGAATAARQDTGNTSLNSIDTKTPSLGQALAAASVPVVLTAAQITTLTPLATVAATQSGTWNVGTVTTLTGITNALPAGTNAIGKLAANSGVDIGDVDVTSISAGSNLIGDVGLSGARTSGGATLFSNNGTSTKTQIKATAGQIYWLHCINLNATVVYLQIFNLASASVTLGTTVPDLQFPVPTAGSTNGAGFNLPIPNGQAFSAGITYAITTTKSGATAATADTAFLNGGYA